MPDPYPGWGEVGRWLGSCAIVLLFACGCGDSSVPEGLACVEGQSAPCGCRGGFSGQRICLADGTYDACECADAAPGDGATAHEDDDPRDGGGSGDAAGARSGGGRAGGGDAAGSAGEPQAGAGAGAAGAGGSAGSTGSGGSAGASGNGGSAGSAGSAGTSGSAGGVCTPNELGCTMNFGVHVVTRCNEAGTSVTAERACSMNQYCEDGACHAQACSPNRFYCMSGELRHCDEIGSSYVVEQICENQQRCDAEARSCVTECTPEGCGCNAGSSPCCMPSGACGCSVAGLTACTTGFSTGAERCECP